MPDIDNLLNSLPETVGPVPPAPSKEEKVVDANTSPLEQLEMDEPIFTDGPTRAEIEELKKQYTGSQIMATLLADGQGIVWRTLNRLEWKAVQAITRRIEDPDKKEEIIFARVVLFPDCKDQNVVGLLPAGAVTAVLNEWYLMNGFTPVTESLRL